MRSQPNPDGCSVESIIILDHCESFAKFWIMFLYVTDYVSSSKSSLRTFLISQTFSLIPLPWGGACMWICAYTCVGVCVCVCVSVYVSVHLNIFCVNMCKIICKCFALLKARHAKYQLLLLSLYNYITLEQSTSLSLTLFFHGVI